MKNKLGIILKTKLTNTYKVKSITKKKLLLYIILFLYIAASIFIMLNEFLTNLYEMLLSNHLQNYYLTTLFSLSSLFVLFFTIFSTKNALFDNKDNDLLFSLPIDKKIILLSRFIGISIYNFILSLFIIIPGLFVYFSNEFLELHALLVIILLTLCSNIIPTILASLFGYLIALITSKSKHKSRIELISYILFIGLYMLIVYQENNLLELFMKNPDLFTKILKYIFFPIYLINLSITESNYLYIFLYLLCTFGLLFLFIFLLNKKYYQIIMRLKIEKSPANFKMSTLKRNSPMLALTKKEIKRYFQSAIYVFNTSFGMILLLIASVASFFYKPIELLSMIGEDATSNSFMLVLYLILFTVSFSATTNSSISIERNNFWILKMLPMKEKEILKAKKYVNLLLILPVAILSLILFLSSGYITGLELLALIIITIFLSLTIANFGLICNLLFPKLDASNDTVIVKQSTSAMIGIMVPIIFVVIYIVITESFSQNLIIITTLILSIFLSIITNLILNTWGIKKYRSL